MENNLKVSVLEQKLSTIKNDLHILRKELVNRQKERVYSERLFDTFGSNQDANKDVIDVVNLSIENMRLQSELEGLRKQNTDIMSDMKVLRKKQNRDNESSSAISKTTDSPDTGDKSDLITELEQLHLKYKNLESDFHALLDEKEELLRERDLYRQKANRLNHELQNALHADVNTFCDVDALVMENRNLQLKLNSAQNEKEFLNQVLTKCMELLETRKTRCSLRIGSISSSGMHVTYKQMYQLLDSKNPAVLSASRLRHLSVALLDLLQDESIALLHQKKINKSLANRITEVEYLLNKEASKNDGENPLKNTPPSQILLRGYAEIDAETAKERYADIIDKLSPDVQNLFQEAIASISGSSSALKNK